ncbi:lactonase family protein [Algoriphagus sanaruensis]|uniref:6-phosphogluconolactonase n=1 Tax=Algoriphagus sanaruensis TaxID=1727163 RepID=A0A142ER68_9BACT|nr:lactonase family protein [Algoriphagus sanaruensis]AMQ57623.1 hypothetical protein AO498_14320 [Algoriphagus sanaruensis]
MKTSLAVVLSLALFTACSSPKSPSESSLTEPMDTKTYEFLIGTYTDSLHHGINYLSLSPNENLLTVETIAAGIANPSYVIATKDGSKVFALEEEAGIAGGKVLSFSRNTQDQTLTLIDQKDSGGDHPCHISISPKEDFLILSNYTGGSLSLFRIDSLGMLSHVQTIQHYGKSINSDRQEKPHVHSTNFDREGKRVIAADLGTDKLYVYQFDPSSEKSPLTLEQEFPMTPGDGPRHMAFSPAGNGLFVVEELTATLDIFDYSSGQLTSKQRLSLLESGFTGSVGAAEVRVSPDGKFIYVSNRGEANTISVFGKRPSGEYVWVENVPSGGKMPRNFALTDDGKYLLSAHQASNDLVVFERNPETGKLTQTLWRASIHKPVYLHQLP